MQKDNYDFIRTVSGYPENGDVHAFIDASEKKFNDEIDKVSDAIARSGKQVVFLAGPTCSGKTTTAEHLIGRIREDGRTAHVVSIDSFFRDHIGQRKVGEEVDFDSVDAIDLDLFASCTEELLTKGEALIPDYDFHTQSRSRYVPLAIEKGDTVVFEGIQAVYPEVTAILHRYDATGIFIRPESAIACGDQIIPPNGIRLLRRLVRDYRYRSASPEFTLYLWRQVRENEERSIFPNIGEAAYRIDSTLAYEGAVLKPYLEEILPLVPKTSPYFAQAQELLSLIAPFTPISYDLIPPDSVYTEFLGKKTHPHTGDNKKKD